MKRIALIIAAGLALLTACSTDPTQQEASSSSVPKLTPEQTDAISTCVIEASRKDYTPADDLNKKLLDACKATGKTLYDSLPEQVRGDAKVGWTPANADLKLRETKSVHDATYLVRFLAGVKDAASEGEVITDTKSMSIQITAAFPGVTQGDIQVGSQGDNPVIISNNQNTARGQNDFLKGDGELESTTDIAKWFASNEPEAVAAFGHVEKAIRDAGYGDDEVARAKNGTGYIPIQFKDASQVLGTGYIKDGQVLVLGTWRQAKAGDVYWLFVTKDGKLILDATLRGKCANPGITQVVVVRPGMPQAPPVEQPPGKETCPPGTSHNSTTGYCENPPPSGCKEHNNCNPPPKCKTPPCELEQKKPGQIPGNGGEGDGGSGQYGGTRGEKQTAPEADKGPPKAGNPPVTTTQRPAPTGTRPIPGGTPTTTQAPPPVQGTTPPNGGANDGDLGPGGL